MTVPPPPVASGHKSCRDLIFKAKNLSTWSKILEVLVQAHWLALRSVERRVSMVRSVIKDVQQNLIIFSKIAPVVPSFLFIPPFSALSVLNDDPSATHTSFVVPCLPAADSSGTQEARG